MPYPIDQRAHQFNSIQSVPVSFGLWDTALIFLSPGPRSDVTDHLDKEDIKQISSGSTKHNPGISIKIEVASGFDRVADCINKGPLVPFSRGEGEV